MSNMYEILVGSLAAAACWAVWFYCLKEQRVDTFREKLFDLRKELFLLAASGSISFESRSYIDLRNLINGMLRHAHRISFSASFVASRMADLDPAPANHFAAWHESLSSLAPEVQAHLRSIHLRMGRAYINHLVGGSIVLSLFYLRFLTAATLSGMLASLTKKQKPTRDAVDEAFNRLANSFDAQALEEQAYRDQTGSQHPLPA